LSLEHSFLCKMCKKLSPRDIFHKDINISSVLCKSLKFYLNGFKNYNKRMANRTQNIILVINMVHLFGFDYLFLSHYLYTQVFAAIFFLHQSNCSKSSYIYQDLPYPMTVRYSNSSIIWFQLLFLFIFFYIIIMILN
jgi:hypothetical protein